jgi:hypothetical protein
MLVEFSGWCQIDDSVVQFQNMEDDSIISGTDYLLLSDEEKECYVLEDMIATLRDSNDNEWTDIQVERDDE